MADRPILFSAPMVRALLEGRKTQTRRLVNPQPFAGGYYEGSVELTVIPADGRGPKAFRFNAGAVGGGAILEEVFEPRINTGDRLYVREAWRVSNKHDACSPSNSHNGSPVLEPKTMTVLFEAGGSIANHDIPPEEIHYRPFTSGCMPESEWRPDPWPPAGSLPPWAGKVRQGMHLPRWASRITLEVTDVRVEPLMSISPEDAIAEGLIKIAHASPDAVEMGCDYGFDGDSRYGSPVSAYAALWNSINAKAPWSSNPWVVAYSFRFRLGNIDLLSEAA